MDVDKHIAALAKLYSRSSLLLTCAEGLEVFSVDLTDQLLATVFLYTKQVKSSVHPDRFCHCCQKVYGDKKQPIRRAKDSPRPHETEGRDRIVERSKHYCKGGRPKKKSRPPSVPYTIL